MASVCGNGRAHLALLLLGRVGLVLRGVVQAPRLRVELVLELDGGGLEGVELRVLHVDLLVVHRLDQGLGVHLRGDEVDED